MYMKKIILNNDTFFLKFDFIYFYKQHLTTFDNGLYPSSNAHLHHKFLGGSYLLAYGLHEPRNGQHETISYLKGGFYFEIL